MIRRVDGSVERLAEGLSNPLGVTVSGRHTQADAFLADGETLLLYTDGLVERRGESIDEGIGRLAEAFADTGPDPEAVCERLAAQLQADGPDDDVAILAVRRTGLADRELHSVVAAHPSRLVELRRRFGAWLTAQGADRSEVNDIVLAVHEACMNAVEHAYGPADAEIEVVARIEGDLVEVTVSDSGSWRPARNEHRGRGQAIMSSVMDEVTTETGTRGSTVRLRRRLRKIAQA
jgi:anti-sigma regulatory factor (Ser/Thr protein kinase)